jgi:signal transduction histidine kinase
MIFSASSWVLTLAFVAFYLRAHRRLVLVARAAHELRGPLFAMQLGLHGLGGEPARLAAIELELRRAGRALDDLTAAPSGGRAETSRELVDLTELVESYAPAWRTLASGYGAQLRVEPPLIVTRFEGGELAAGGCAWPRRRAWADPPPHGRMADSAVPRGTPPVSDASPPGPAAGRVPPVADALPPGPAAGRVPPVADASPAARAAESAGRRAMSSGAHAAAMVFADPLRIAQACANLIGNAAEHGGGGVVRVRVRATGARVRIEVADDGPGLPMSVTALTATARARRGRRGHGLAIAAAIAEHHGGRLHSAPSDGGARLMLEMPAANEPVVA